MLANNLKMVIWDLDETFWRGTLTEGEVELIPANVEMVKTLAARGIVSSICSKNKFDDARKVLEDCGIWSYFVFPTIEFAAKGAAIAALIENANLRPDNVLFVDDNILNLKEAAFYAPNLMTALPEQVLPELLSLPQAKGKDDSALSRLNQYKLLETKIRDRTETPLKNEDFLRQCEIAVDIDIDVEPHLDRVIELINRSNQLNFTKIRIETPDAVAEFKAQLRKYGVHAGIVRASDKYGDYGIVGFFMTSRFAGSYVLVHFVFSCRIMNMGVEQYVYEMLGEPLCRIVPPVSNGLKDFPAVDWIRAGRAGDGTAAPAGTDARLLLMGGCDLMQMATYCSNNRAEYVNRVDHSVMVRYDDPGFVLSPRAAVPNSKAIDHLPTWNKDDAVRFDAELAETETVVISLWEAMNGDYMLLDEQVMVRVAPGFLGRRLGKLRGGLGEVKFIRLSVPQKLALIARSLERIAALSPGAKSRFLLGANTRKIAGPAADLRKAYNAAAASYCIQSGTFDFVAVDDVVPKQEVLDELHYTRKGYFALAEELKRRQIAGRQLRTPVLPSLALRDVIDACEVLDLSAVQANRRGRAKSA